MMAAMTYASLRLALPPAALLSAILFAAGCDCAGPSPVGCAGSADCATGEICRDGMCEPAPPETDSGVTPDSGPTPVPITATSVRIEPSTATLTSIAGSMPSQDFEAIVIYSDGSERTALGPLFGLDAPTIGLLDPASGLFTANGTIGGTAVVDVSVPNGAGDPLTATATVTVTLENTLRGEGVTDEDVARFGTATPVDDAGREAAVVYPLDGVVMPQNVFPADVQWTRSAGGDLFRVTLAKPRVSITAYLAHDPSMHWLVDQAAWRALAQTDPDAAAILTVDRLEAASGELVRGAPIQLTFARAALSGSVYYWDVARGRIVRIDDGTATRVEFMPTPTPSPLTGERCVGCHSVSNSGRYMVGRLGGGDNVAGIYDLTSDLAVDPPPTTWPVTAGSLRWWFSSWNPDDSRLVVAYRGGNPQLGFVDPATGAEITPSGAMPLGTYPSWSPDGASIAYVADQNGWGDAPTVGNIYMLPVTGLDSVGTPSLVHAASSIPGNTVDSYPTWSPDSRLLAFASGTGARSESVGVPVNLYAMGRDGSNVVPLTRAASTGMDYQPRFSPFQQGGYYWLSFLSRRLYGNPVIGNAPSAENLRQQIWVAAVRADAAAGEDPSAVAYWLPGQNTRSANISAFWAPRACRADGEGCSVGSECCGGDCRPPAGGGAPVCSPPPPDRCRNEGETCNDTADCCAGMDLSCSLNVCTAGPG